MNHSQRKGFSPAQRAELWSRWRDGESVASISRALTKPPPSISYILSAKGGIYPPSRQRAKRSLTLTEREEISRGVSSQQSIRAIAVQIGRSPSTISREIQRNGGYAQYRAAAADQRAWDKARRPKPCKLALDDKLRQLVADKLQLNWSPEQIAGWLKRTYPTTERYRVSHETIYRSLYIQTRGVLKRELQKHLRSKRSIRHGKVAQEEKRGHIPDAVSISQRPACIEDRAVPGHWEGDLIEGSKLSYIATLVERHSRYVMLVKVNSKETLEVVNKLVLQSKLLPCELYKSLTWDRGPELKAHQRFTMATDIAVYFCDPRSPWQRGSNENTNRLLRQYFPKGTDLSVHSQDDLDKVARELNERPRKTLDYETPAQRFETCVASIS